MNTQILENIRTLKRQLLPNEKSKEFEDEDKYAYPFSEMGLKYDTYISAKVYAVKDWEAHPSIFRYNVERERIEIV